MFDRFKLKIVNRLFKNGEFILIYANKEDGEHFNGGMYGTRELHCIPSILSNAVFENNGIRALILDVAKTYLKRHEVDGKNFAEEILSND